MRLRVLSENEVALEVMNGVPVCSISEISRFLEIDRATVAKVIKKHNIKPAKLRKTHPIYPLSVVARRVINSRFW